MEKDKLIALWNAKDWDNCSSGLYFTGRYAGRDIYFNFTKYSEADVLSLSDDFMQQLAAKLEQLDHEAHEIIQKENPDEDSSELELTDIMFDCDGCCGNFALGYDAGDSPAGRLYLIVKFDEQFRPDQELIYETY